MNILMLSSSRAGNEDYLASARSMITDHLEGIDQLLFIPFAGVTIDWDHYTRKVSDALPGVEVKGIHSFSDPQLALKNAKAVAVGGGNTFSLLNELYRQNLLDLLRERAMSGAPYIGWSAGSNICGQSIRTTNDMPIVQPPSFDALNLVPFQLNPHYSDYQPPGHNGETRAQRLEEFCTLNPDMPVIGLREGSALCRKSQALRLLGDSDAIVFKGNTQMKVKPEQDLSHYLTE